MKKILLLAVMMAWTSTILAQPFNLHWIASPQIDSTSQVWFRQQLQLRERPVFASVTVATTGKIDLYINERNVSTAIWMPDRTGNDNQPVSISMEVTRFLRPGDNTIAIWYSPCFPHLNEQQIAFSLSGRMSNGEEIALTSDKSWLTRQANGSLTADGGERYNAYAYPLKWNADDIDWAMWTPAQETHAQTACQRYYSAGYPAAKRNKTYMPRYFDLAGDSVYYQFDKAFRGQIRVTLRNAKRGQKLYIDGLEYICTGEMDEQACRRFTVTDHHRVLIWGDKNFKKSQIQAIEGIEIVPYFHNSLQF